MPLWLARFKTWSRTRRTVATVAALLFAVAFGRFVWFWYLSKPSRQITIGRDTTYLDGPLGDDGCVDYIAAVELRAAAGATPENNAVVLLWEAYGSKQTTLEDWADQFRRLGAPVPSVAVVETIPLDLLVEASRRSRYYAPMIIHSNDDQVRSLWNVLLPLTQSQRDGMTRLVNRAGQRLAAGEFESAWSDGLAGHRLARLMAQDPFLMNSLSAFAYERMALDFDEALLASEHLTTERARSCLADLEALMPAPTVSDKLDHADRLAMLDAALVTARGEAIGYPPEERIELALPGAIDWDIVLRTINAYYDRYVAALRDPDKATRAALLAELAGERVKLSQSRMAFALQAYLGQREQASRDFAQALLGSTGEHVLKAHEVESSVTARFRAVCIGFALAAWQREHGEYPESLQVLVPDLLPEIATDSVTGQPFLYRRTESGYEITRQAVPPDDVILRIGDAGTDE